MKALIVLLVPIWLAACKNKSAEKAHLPSNLYEYVKVDTTTFTDKHAVYVPVYSHIYTEAGTSSVALATTLSIRNTSFSDTIYVTDVVYYGSQGEVLKRYLDSTVFLQPMHSIEFVVERREAIGGAGANFVVHWGAFTKGASPLIQTVMVETGTGVSFVTDGLEMR